MGFGTIRVTKQNILLVYNTLSHATHMWTSAHTYVRMHYIAQTIDHTYVHAHVPAES